MPDWRARFHLSISRSRRSIVMNQPCSSLLRPPGRRSEGFIEPCLPTVADMTPGGPAMTGAGFAKGAQRVIYFLENDPPRECRNIVQSRAE
jgi:hypothetical protein